MPPRSLSGLSSRSPICVSRFDDLESCGSSTDVKTSQKRSIPLVRNVTFAEQNEVFEITHLDDIPSEDVANIWYEAGEYAQIKKNYQLTIFLMESGEKLKEDDEHTSRGLEYRTQEGAWARYENKRDAYNAVLDEQDRQWKEDIDDWDAISRVYLEHSDKCLKAARERGSSDESVIADFIKEVLKVKKKKKKAKGEKDKDGKSKSKKSSSKDADGKKKSSSKSTKASKEKRAAA